jgi:sugar phosphate isomerase/epimerase
MEPAALDVFAARARAVGVEIEVGARGLTLEHLSTYLAVARRLGSRLLRFVIDAPGYEPSVDEVVGLLRDALPTLRKSDVTLGIENHDRFPSTTLRQIVGDLGSEHVGVCLDTANSLGAGEGIREVLAALAPVCVNLHVKDFAIARLPYLMGFTVTGRALGEGMLPLREVIETVARLGRCQTAIVETWPPPETEISATLEKEVDWAIRSVRALRAALADEPHRKNSICQAAPLGRSLDEFRPPDHDRVL